MVTAERTYENICLFSMEVLGEDERNSKTEFHRNGTISFFTCCVWMSGLLGKNPQAANQIALNLSTITYMVAMGLSVVAMIRVGNQKGKKNFIELRRVAISVFLLIFILDIFFCLTFILLHNQLPWIYLDSKNLINSLVFL